VRCIAGTGEVNRNQMTFMPKVAANLVFDARAVELSSAQQPV
jgi:hypothetical protein